MKKIFVMLTSVMLAAATTATAGGILTNTNQSIDFLRNPARDAAIGLDEPRICTWSQEQR